jgi:serine/threonine protein kinase
MESDSSKKGGDEARRRAMETIAPGKVPPATGSGSFGGAAGAAPEIQATGYTFGRELGRGGQAVVYLALQQSTGRKVAIKVFRQQALADEQALARFKREVQVLAALDHPNIVGIVDTGTASDGSHFIVMSYVAGLPLDEYVKQVQDNANPARVLKLFLKICAAVNVAHLRGIVHRDLKPSNIRIDERGEPHILDFGLAHTALDHLAGREGPVSVTGEFLGSLPWCSPEQAEAEPERIDIRSDVYSLGVILYQILTGGEFPYVVVGNIRDVLDNILKVAPTPPSKRAQKADYGRMGLPPINSTIERIVLKALAKNREERYQSAGELGREIAGYLGGQRAAAPAATTAPEPVPPAAASRNWAKIGVLAGIVMVAIGFGVWGFMRTPGPQQNGAVAVAPPTAVATPPAVVAPPAAVAPAVSVAATSEVSPITVAGPLNASLTMIAGGCHMDGEELGLTPGIKGTATLLFGDSRWANYDLTFKANLNGGRGFWAETNVNVGNFGQIVVNTIEDNLAVLWHHAGTAERLSPLQHFRLEPHQWYTVTVRVRGQEIHVLIDGQEYLSALGDELRTGRIGIGTRSPAARFKDIEVRSAEGEILWKGPPDLSTLPPVDVREPAATEPAASEPAATMP